jgi:hypothetical protein
VLECRATIADSMSGRAVALWLSAIDSVAAIVTISGPVDGDQLTAWRTSLESSYGAVGARVQGIQWMLQWIRGGQMLRLTWRVDQREKLASVSLVDGPLLDGWGRQRIRHR